MTEDQEAAYWTLQSKSTGLEETFLGVATSFIVDSDDIEYAKDACKEILEAIKVIEKSL